MNAGSAGGAARVIRCLRTSVAALVCLAAMPLAGADETCRSDFLGAGDAAGTDLPSLQPAPLSPPAWATVRLGGALEEVLVYSASSDTGGVTLEIASADGESLRSAAAGSSAGSPVPLTAAIESPAAFLPRSDGSALRGYVGDAAGRLWRLDLPPVPAGAAPADHWALSLFAELGAVEGAESGPVFPVAPELFRAIDGAGVAFDGVLAAGIVNVGDTARVDLFLLRDYAVGSRSRMPPLVTADLEDAAVCAGAGGDCPRSTGAGWRRRGVAPGDALAGAPLLDGGRVFLATWSRLSQDCDTGEANRYVVVLPVADAAGEISGPLELAPGRPMAPGLGGGLVILPGLEEALADAGMDAAPLLAARCLVPRRLYWRDLRLDRD